MDILIYTLEKYEAAGMLPFFALLCIPLVLALIVWVIGYSIETVGGNRAKKRYFKNNPIK